MSPHESARRKLLLASAAATAAAAVPFGAVRAQDAASFPTKPIRIVVPFNAGSGSDTYSRLYGEMLSKDFGQPVIVENRPGGNGSIGIQAVTKAPADGYTMLLASNSPMAVNPVVFKQLNYDPFKDLKPVHGIFVGPSAFVVRADSPYKTIQELVAAAKKEKRPVSIGNYSQGYQLAAAWLGHVAGVPITHVYYKGGAQMITDIVGGSLEVAAMDFGGIAPQLKDGRVRVLAITSDKRRPAFPDIPTMIESGFPGFETYVWISFYVRSETPDAIQNKLAAAMEKVMSSPAAKEYQALQPVDPLMLGPAEMAAFHRKEYERFKSAAEAAGIEPQ